MDKEELAKNIIRELPTALYRWYPFAKGTRLLYVGEADAVFGMLSRKDDLQVEQIGQDEDGGDFPGRFAFRFDYVLLSAETVECSRDLEALLTACVRCLADRGILLLSMRNRLGIRYFCGDRDPYTHRCFDGVEDYIQSDANDKKKASGRLYDEAELELLLKKVGLQKANRFSVFPGLENPAMLYEEGFAPTEVLAGRIFPQYSYPQSVFLDERKVYDSLCANGMLHSMANAYLFECVPVGNDGDDIKVSDALQITSSLDRGEQNAFITVIHKNETVTKEAAFDEGKARIRALAENMEYLKSRGIRTVEGKLNGDVYEMPFLHAMTGEAYLKKMLETDPEAYIKKLEEFRDLIYRSSEGYDGIFVPPVPTDENENERRFREKRIKEEWEDRPVRLLKKAFIDLVPLNSFFLDGEFVFFDQEICETDFPADYIMHRVIQIVHDGNAHHQSILDKAGLFRHFGLPDGKNGTDNEKYRYFRLDMQIMRNLRNERTLEKYYRQVRQEPGIMAMNRERMNYSVSDYKRLFEDTFAGIEHRKLILFGSGKYASVFLSRYGAHFSVFATLDNDPARQGEMLYPEGYGKAETGKDHDLEGRGVRIESPELLRTLKHGEYKVIICIKNYMAVMQQLDQMGISEYAIYDPVREYNVPLVSLVTRDTGMRSEKKYHIGYTAGAFDMFHVGHLNLLRRAKEMCDHLIVGVMSDEAIRNFKMTEPVIPLADRMEIIRGCRYVDEVVEIPYMRGDSAEAWKLYHFDVQFCGSDYIGDEGRMREKEFLEAHGATLEIFPYTEKVSSSMLRKQLDEQEDKD